MRRKLSRSLSFLVLVIVALVTADFSSFTHPSYSASAKAEIDDSVRPIVFVHGMSGSGAQFQSQAMRFTSNGYPAHYIAAHEYNSTEAIGGGGRDGRYDRLDQLIDQLLNETGADQIDLIGHSLGTAEMIGYLESSPERAEKVAHYVNVDGRTSEHLPGGVPTLALWAEIGGAEGREIVGAKNVIIPGQAHTEVTTSKESFVEMYRFFNDKEPATNEILAETGQITLAGKASLFPQNVTPGQATVEIYEINRKTGQRLKDSSDATYPIGENGDWGPFEAKSGSSYEFVLVREGAANHHFYFEPFIRSDNMIRLLTSPPTGGMSDLMDVSDEHSSLVIQRNMEFFGEGAHQDSLKINGENIVNEHNAPISKRLISYFVFDEDADQESNLTVPVASIDALPFLTGVDLFIPASRPPEGTISLELLSRASDGIKQVINLPNWASEKDRVSILFNDFTTDVLNEIEDPIDEDDNDKDKDKDKDDEQKPGSDDDDGKKDDEDETPKNGDDTDKDKTTNENDKKIGSNGKESEGKELANTATNMYTYLLIGALITIASLAFLIYRRKRAIE